MPFEVDVLCVGHAAFDLVMSVDHHPGPDEKCHATSLLASGGGPAANAAVTVARLGGKSAFAGYLGDDFYGREHLSELMAEGVNTDLVVRGRHPTPVSLILAKPGGERTVVNHKAGTPLLGSKEIDFSRCRPKVILFDGHEPLLSPPLAKAAKDAGIRTVLDAGSVHRGTLDLMHCVDYLITSERFAHDFSGTNDVSQALSTLSGHAPFVVITRGAKGLVWSTRRGSGAMPAFPAKAVDTTGAGDTFHGAFALCTARGNDFDEALRYASAAAALNCTKLGARPGIPAGEQVDAYLRGI